MRPLTADEVAILTADAVTVSAGCELLNADLSFREDISNDLVGGQVERNFYATIHGTVDLSLTRALRWGVDLVRPYMVLTDGARTARFNVGVYALTTPQRKVGESVETYDVQGYDRVYLLNRQVGYTYTIGATHLVGGVSTATTYRKALLDTFAAAGLTGVLIEGSAADSTLPKTLTWPLVGSSTDPDQTDTPVTWLRVINDLLRAINFSAVYADLNGVFRCEAYILPSLRAPEFTFDADNVAFTIVGEDRLVTEDVWATPNRWVFRNTARPDGAPAPTEGDGIYTRINQSDGLTSIDARGLTWTAVIDYDAANQAKLVDLGDRRVAMDRRVTAKLEVTTGPWPCAGHADVYTFVDAATGGTRKVLAPRWSFDLSGSDVQWDWETIG